MNWKIHNEDAVQWAKNYDGMPFHALLCDPPYHLTTIVKRFGKTNSKTPGVVVDRINRGADGYARYARGFMGQTWDGGDVAFDPATWEAFGNVMFDGAFGMAFSASRNWHRLAVAIEDAGFIIHPTIFGWLNGQGFPKATRVKGEVAFEGHRYGLQALKPAVEPIIVFQKPYDGKPINNIVNTGAGALNIDGGRIPLANDDEYTINTFDDGAKPWGKGAGHKYTSRPVKWTSPRGGIWTTDKDAKSDLVESNQGRWPANFVLSEENAERLDRQSEEVSRFFFNVSSQIDEADPIFYSAKVSPKERNAGLQSFEEKERSFMNTHNGNPAEGETWHPIDERTGESRDRFKSKTRNPHPTLKPISLSKYLAALLLPPAEYSPRRIFVPFSGVGSEMIGACLAGWEEVVGVEFDKENDYVNIAEKRLEHWTK